MAISAQYDRQADALYVRLSDAERERAVEVDDATYVDVGADGGVVGLEFLYPSLGLGLEAVTRRFSLEEQLPAIIAAITGSGAPVSPPTMTGGQHIASTAVVTWAVEGTVPASRTESETAHTADPASAGVAIPA